jgi:hypothetical protein
MLMFVSACLSVRLSGSDNSRTIERIFIKFDNGGGLLKFIEMSQP